MENHSGGIEAVGNGSGAVGERIEAVGDGSGAVFLRDSSAFAFGTDSAMLAEFTKTSGVRYVMDLGCGGGTLVILLAMKSSGARFRGIEILPEATEIARENVRLNGLETRIEIVTADLRDFRQSSEAGAYDLVVSNPPYFPVGSGRASSDPARAIARDERNCTLSQLCETAAYLCRWGGSFSLVHRPERLSEVFVEMTRHGIEPKRLRLVMYRSGAAPNLALIEGRRGGKPGLEIEPPRILTDG